MASKPLGCPKVIEFAFQDYRADGVTKGRSAECRTCGRTVKEKAGTTSNFLRHLRKHHLNLYQVYQDSKRSALPLAVVPKVEYKVQVEPQPAPKITTPKKRHATPKQVVATPENSGNSVPVQNSATNTKRKEDALMDSILDLIVGDSLPIAIVESPRFVNFVKKVNRKSREVGREETKNALITRSAEIWADVWKRISAVQSVNATVDVWSDGKRKFFIAVTAHFIEKHPDGLRLSNLLMSCQRIVGTLGGDEIRTTFSRIIEDFSLERKLDYVTYTTPDKIKNAMLLSYLPPDPNDPYVEFTLDRGDYIDDNDLWVPLNEKCEQALSTEIHSLARHPTLKCFTHTLHLCIAEVLQKAEGIQYAVLKICRLATSIRTNSSLTELLKRSGVELSKIVKNTRKWDDTLHNIKAIISCDFQKLANACPEHIALELDEYYLLHELVMMLNPFLEASDLAKNGVNHTISVVVPTVLALYKHLLNFVSKSKFLHKVATDLVDSIYRHFQGVFANVGMTSSHEAASVLDYGESIYVHAAVLDPLFGLHWLRDVHADEEAKSILRKRVIDDILMESESRICLGKDSPSQSRYTEEDGPLRKAMKLFAHYKKEEGQQGLASTQLQQYLDMVDKGSEGRTCFQFWSKYKDKFNLLYPLANTVLSLSASSTEIERVFAYGGIVTKQRQCVLDNHTLSHLLFLKAHEGYQLQNQSQS